MGSILVFVAMQSLSQLLSSAVAVGEQPLKTQKGTGIAVLQSNSMDTKIWTFYHFHMLQNTLFPSIENCS